ncbi:Nucleoid occlusion factor SlmA [subsurface metagenome]|jgi:AcrR family transcriptional regulator|nr:TetR family transcriptional regulator [Clostridia bacterium]RXG65376.1 MAG: TetR/AcrR family transcriptional regulator [Candidatus Atribacteria bacterium 1244-E10-H5-B2]
MKNINKKEKILEAAQEVFFKKSFYEATMDDIAQLSGIKKPTIYYYFPSKIDLASQLLEVNIKKIFGKISEIISSTNKVKDRIKMIVDFYISLLEENSKIFIIIQRISYDFMQKEDSKKKINELFEKLRKKQKKAGNLFGEVILSSGKRVSGDIFLYSLVAALGRVIFENVSHGRKPKKDDLLVIGDIFSASVK